MISIKKYNVEHGELKIFFNRGYDETGILILKIFNNEHPVFMKNEIDSNFINIELSHFNCGDKGLIDIVSKKDSQVYQKVFRVPVFSRKSNQIIDRNLEDLTGKKFMISEDIFIDTLEISKQSDILLKG